MNVRSLQGHKLQLMAVGVSAQAVPAADMIVEENLKPAAKKLAENAPQAARKFNEEVLRPNAEGIAAEVCA